MLLITQAACSENANEETGYNGRWYFDAEYHWRDPDEDGDDWRGPHNFINDVCNLCGYSRRTGTIEPNPDNPSGGDPSDGPSGGGQGPNQSGQGDPVVDGLSYTPLYGEDTTVGYSVGVGDKKSDATIAIPAEYNGKPVVAIDDYGFKGVSSLKTITIPDTVTAIGYESFANCSSLQELVIPDSVTFMDGRAFLGCSALKNVTLSKKLTTLYYKVFYRCSSLKEMEFPEGLANIQRDAFAHCSSLTKVVFPKSLQRVDSSVFHDCKSLHKVIAYDIDSWLKIKFTGVESNPLLNGSDLIFNSSGTEEVFTELTVPNTMKSIGSFQFSNCTSLEKVTIPESVTEIGMCAFTGCTKLKTISADGIKIVDQQTFAYMPALTTISLKGVERVERDAFYESAKLTTIYFGPQLTRLGQRCCYGTALKDVYIVGGSKEMWGRVVKYGVGISNIAPGDCWNYRLGTYTIHFVDEDLHETGEGSLQETGEDYK